MLQKYQKNPTTWVKTIPAWLRFAQACDNKKHHIFSSAAAARYKIPTTLGMVIKEVRAIFCTPNFFDPINSFAARPRKNAYNLIVWKLPKDAY